MGKYDGLGDHLNDDNSERIALSFTEIETILGFTLPNSAKKYRPWWANDPSHVQAKDGWLRVGYETGPVHIKDQIATFRKTGENIPNSVEATSSDPMSPRDFEKHAQNLLGINFSVPLSHRKKENWPKLFDLVSEDFNIVGDAKYYTMVHGKSLPPAKFSVIAEHVWMLEKIDAETRFLVFGNDKRVPLEWLKRYGVYNNKVSFYFLSDDGNLELLNKIG